MRDIENISDSDFEALLDRSIPQPVPLRPFHENSTVDDINTTAIGRPDLTDRRIVAEKGENVILDVHGVHYATEKKNLPDPKSIHILEQ